MYNFSRLLYYIINNDNASIVLPIKSELVFDNSLTGVFFMRLRLEYA